MTKVKLHVLVLMTALFLIFFTVNAQAQEDIVRCGTDAHHTHLLETDEAYQKRYEQLQTWLAKQQTITSELRSAEESCPITYTIPVAVHYQGLGGSFDTDCLTTLAQSQIDVLNADYSATNADIELWDAVSSAFPDVLPGNACLEFCLASTNHPAGFGLSDGAPAITFNETSGDFDSDWSGYINIFVRNAGGGILGYSPLGGNGNGDGVVITHCAFGLRLGCADSGPDSGCGGSGWVYDLGRTLTHELGHYLLLDHVFNGCGVGDFVDDTPPSNSPSYGCPSLGSGTSSCGSQDMFMNYMDYVNDACMFLFTAGQATRMNDYATTGLTSVIANGDVVCGPVVIEPPIAGFTTSETEVCPDDPSINFTSTSTGGALNYEWTFDGAGVSPSSSNSSSPTVTVATSGDLTVSLVVSNEAGSNEVAQTITITVLSEDDAICIAPPCAEAADIYDQLNFVLPGGSAPSSSDGECGSPYTFTGFQVWSSEGYTVNNVQEGESYIVDICTGPDAGSWPSILTVEAPSGAVEAVAANCAVTFTASETGQYTIYINEEGECGSSTNFTDNGFIQIQCVDVVACETPITANVTAACNLDAAGTATFTIVVSGGDGDYSIVSADGTEFTSLDDNTFTAEISSLNTLVATIDDGSEECEPLQISQTTECPVCETSISAILEVNCDDTGSGAATVMLTTVGGNGNYSISSDIGFTEDTDGSFMASANNGDLIVATVTDDSVCEAITVETIVECTVTPIAPEVTNGDIEVAYASGDVIIDLNDYSFDANGDVLSYALIEMGMGGSFTIEDNVVTFSPDFGYVGTTSFDFTVSDGTFDVDGNISITVALSCAEVAPIQAFLNIAFDAVTDVLNVFVTVEGGGFTDASGTYTLTANDFTTTIETMEVYSSLNIPLADLEGYEVVVTDDLGCSVTLFQPIGTTVAIDLISFTGEAQENSNTLKWVTASETNNAFFNLYRSFDGVNFTAIARIAGAGNSNTANTYYYNDSNIISGVTYYRLSQTDFDGTLTEAGSISIQRNGTFNLLNVQPTPTQNTLIINFTSVTSGQLTANLYDLTGRLIITHQADTQAGFNSMLWDVSTLSSGLYLLSIDNGNEMISTKIVKE